MNPQSDQSVCNCPTIGREKVKFAYCPVHGASAAMDHLHALDAEAKAEPRVSTVLNRTVADDRWAVLQTHLSHSVDAARACEPLTVEQRKLAGVYLHQIAEAVTHAS